MDNQFNNVTQVSQTVPLPSQSPASEASLQQALSAAIAAGKTGDIKAALEHSANALKLAPEGHLPARVTRGWAIYRALRQVTIRRDESAPQGLDVVRPLFGELAADTLPLLPRPDLLFSLLLSECCRFARHIPQAGLLFASVGELKFRDEDFVRYHPANGPAEGFDSLVEKLIATVHRTAKAMQADPHAPSNEVTAYAQWAEAFLETHIARFPSQEWFPYYLSLLKIQLGKREEARAGIVATLKTNTNAFWAWDLFGRTFDDPSMRLACLCKALACHGTPPEYLINVRASLARLLTDTGMQKEAAIEAALAIAVRQQNKWAIPSALVTLAGGTEIRTSPAANAELYRRFAPVAETAFWSVSGIPVRIGVVESNNADKGVCRIVLSLDESVLAHHDRFPAGACLAPGETVAVRVQSYEHPERGASLRLLTLEKAADRSPDKMLARPFRGHATLHPSGFGFVKTGGIDIFIPPPLCSQTSLKDATPVTGMAIHERKRDKAPGWRAVTITISEGALSCGS